MIKILYLALFLRTNQAISSIDWDYALLELSDPIKLTGNSKARAACLPDPNDKDFAAGTNFVVSGWGRLSSGGVSPSRLHHVTVPAVTDARCKQAYGANRISPRMHCAGNIKDGGVDSCQGDSGGKPSNLSSCY